MFTTPPETPLGGFLEGIANKNLGSQLRAAWLTYVAAQLPNALDAINGGYYQFVADIKLSSNTKQIKINAPAVGQPTKLLGYTTIGLSDDVNYATGQGTLTVSIPATFTQGVTMSGALTFSNTVQFSGAVTFTSTGDITLQSGCDLIGQSGSALNMQAGSTTTLAGAVTINYPVTLNQPIVQTVPDGFVAPSSATIAAPGVNFNIGETGTQVFIGSQTANVVGTLTYASGGVPRMKRVTSTTLTSAFKIDFEFIAFPDVTIATFPAGADRAWVDFYYNGFTWEVSAYGGGTVVY